ncbi:restriction endonuclease subunit S [Streptomyces uncialis]|uniref:restriction endonuclease subunit S n=1 Tax=Streptomyces uncialis TaxID=1048205 RepID=UPI0038638ECD|nr:restriction endonuclease subunit S [Streptomyces uncialis]
MNPATTPVRPDDDGATPPWPSRPLGELCDLRSSPAVGKDARTTDDGVPFVLPRDLKGQRITRTENTTLTHETAHRLRGHALASGDLLMTRTGTVGSCALVTGAESGWLHHMNLIRLRPRRTGDGGVLVSPSYLVACLSATAARTWIGTRSAGMVIPSISMQALASFQVPLPPLEEQQRIGRTLAALDEKIRLHTEIVNTTKELRSVVADLLVTGNLLAGP